jgi:hypothetical protein
LRFLTRRVLPIGILVLLIGGIALIFFGFKTDRHYNTHVSIMRAEVLARACRDYSRHSPDGRFPVGLTDLRSPPPGDDRRVLDDDGSDLTDTWGTPFRYAVVANETGQLEPYVWAERTVDGKTTLLGAKIAADGSVIRFGQPTDE